MFKTEVLKKTKIRTCSSGLLHSVQWQFITDVSGQPLGPVRPLTKGPTGFPETSVSNCHYSLHNNPGVRGSQIYKQYLRLNYIIKEFKHLQLQVHINKIYL